MLTKEHAEKFSRQVWRTYQLFCVWLYVNNQIAKPENYAAVENDPFWSNVLPALNHRWILALACIFDAPYYQEKNYIPISIFGFKLPYYRKTRQEKQPRTSLEYIVRNLKNLEISRKKGVIITRHKNAIEAIQEARKGIAHHPLGERPPIVLNDPQQNKDIFLLFDDLEKSFWK